MTKITATLAGLALVAGASVAPAFAQGNLFSPPGSFTFTTSAGGLLQASGTGETFNPVGVGATSFSNVTFTLFGTAVSGFPGFYDLTSLTILSPIGTPLLVETGPLGFSVTSSPSGSSITSTGAAADGTTFNLVSAPVPEASTTASFGLLLALGLGGLVVAAKRKKAGASL